MKKVLFVLVMALMSLGVQAQEPIEIDEESLVGEWKNVGNEKMELSLYLQGLVQVKSLSLNVNQNCYLARPTDGVQPGGSVAMGLSFTTFFVSNGNKLHLISAYPSQCPSITFVITGLYEYPDYNQTVMYLRPMGSAKDKDYLLYKDGLISGISNTRGHIHNDDRMYNLQGISTESDTGVFITNGKKYLRK